MNNSQIDFKDYRKEYLKSELLESTISSNPFKQFEQWAESAIKMNLYEPNAMILSTATASGRPSNRVVLLKDYSEEGFVFFTNYNSRKGQHISENPAASLLFYWPSLEREISIEGHVVRTSDQESDNYFNSRPRTSQIGAWASEQSTQIDSREYLDQRFTHFQQEFGEEPIPRPGHWGGLRLVPNRFEFWQGRSNRLHDRIVYDLVQTDWVIHRLAP